jgi:DNA-binding IclR family transcriptional regulator
VAGAIGVSAPVLDASGRALASLSVLGPAERLAPRIVQAQEQVVRAAAEITKSMQRSLVGA